MYVYAVSFALKPDEGYAGRLERLMRELRRTPSGMVWAETPSFALVQSDETLDELADRVCLHGMTSLTDTIILFDHHSNMAVARGPIADRALLKAHFRSCEIR